MPYYTGPNEKKLDGREAKPKAIKWSISQTKKEYSSNIQEYYFLFDTDLDERSLC
jgi:hypothetical protein